VYLDLFGGKKAELEKDAVVSLNCNACNVDAKVDKVKGSKAQMSLINKPICVQVDDYITISKKEDGHISLLGRCKVVAGDESTLIE
jgi:translation initiation factor 2 gamma subunit (eIF-2gamma)